MSLSPQTNAPKLRIVTTKIKNRYHARLFVNDMLFDEMACRSRIDIGWICREMLRWYDKGGGMSMFASHARRRQQRGPYDKVWYHLV